MQDDHTGRTPSLTVVVDDQELERKGITLILDSADEITVIGEASTGEEAIPLLIERQSDIVILDIRMPGMGGIEATKIINQRIPRPEPSSLPHSTSMSTQSGACEQGPAPFSSNPRSPKLSLTQCEPSPRGPLS